MATLDVSGPVSLDSPAFPVREEDVSVKKTKPDGADETTQTAVLPAAASQPAPPPPVESSHVIEISDNVNHWDFWRFAPLYFAVLPEIRALILLCALSVAAGAVPGTHNMSGSGWLWEGGRGHVL